MPMPGLEGIPPIIWFPAPKPIPIGCYCMPIPIGCYCMPIGCYCIPIPIGCCPMPIMPCIGMNCWFMFCILLLGPPKFMLSKAANRSLADVGFCWYI